MVDANDDTDEPSISRRHSGILIAPKTLMMSAALLVGGGLGGGGLSFAASNVVPTELRDELAATKKATEELHGAMVVVQATLVRIEAASGGDRLIHDTQNGRITDHEERLRVLERRIR